MKVLLVVMAVLLAGCASSRNKFGEAYVEAHPELDAETRQRILEGQAVQGMTEEQVVAALGGPQSVRNLADGRTFWDYRAASLIFRNGVLVGWVDKSREY